ncbi:MAG: hypothetical protein FGM54_06050 [Chitinophagaceae bacterium]|nr:hypothetical protein [Chitinophagaceae bacterium]
MPATNVGYHSKKNNSLQTERKDKLNSVIDKQIKKKPPRRTVFLMFSHNYLVGAGAASVAGAAAGAASVAGAAAAAAAAAESVATGAAASGAGAASVAGASVVVASVAVVSVDSEQEAKKPKAIANKEIFTNDFIKKDLIVCH